jgi:predicted RNA-binding protein associated with RNAse of E/G family
MPNGTPWLRPVDDTGQPLRLPGGDWKLKEDRLNIDHLGVAVPGEPYSVILMWEEDWKLRCWYINIEEPLKRTNIGFDFMDQTLDIEVAPDLSQWRWKDEEELEEGIAAGIYSRELARQIRVNGEGALERLLARKPPFDERWEDWRPDPAWRKPEISGDWAHAKM